MWPDHVCLLQSNYGILISEESPYFFSFPLQNCRQIRCIVWKIQYERKSSELLQKCVNKIILHCIMNGDVMFWISGVPILHLDSFICITVVGYSGFNLVKCRENCVKHPDIHLWSKCHKSLAWMYSIQRRVDCTW